MVLLIRAFVSTAAGSIFNRLKATDNPFGEVDDDDEGEDVMEASQVSLSAGYGEEGGGGTL